MALNDLIYILDVDVEQVIKDAISHTRQTLSELTDEGTCIIHSGELYHYLKTHHVTLRYIDTKDLGFDYSHHFILVPYGKEVYYLIDLTFRQFTNASNIFYPLLKKGYQLIDEMLWQEYIRIISPNQDIRVSLNNAFWQIKRSR